MVLTPLFKRSCFADSFRNEHNELVDGIEFKVVKRAGPFLDGCSVRTTNKTLK